MALTWQIVWHDRQVAVFAGLMTCLIRYRLNPPPKLKTKDGQLFVVSCLPNLAIAELPDQEGKLYDRGFDSLLLVMNLKSRDASPLKTMRKTKGA